MERARLLEAVVCGEWVVFKFCLMVWQFNEHHLNIREIISLFNFFTFFRASFCLHFLPPQKRRMKYRAVYGRTLAEVKKHLLWGGKQFRMWDSPLGEACVESLQWRILFRGDLEIQKRDSGKRFRRDPLWSEGGRSLKRWFFQMKRYWAVCRLRSVVPQRTEFRRGVSTKIRASSAAGE